MEFTTTDIPGDSNESDEPTDSTPAFIDDEAMPADTRLCKVCGKPLPEHTGRGRKPSTHKECRTVPSSSSVPRASSNGDTMRALATMDTTYQAMVLVARLIDPPLAPKIANNIAEAQRLNRQAFDMDRKLAKRVASLGTPGGIGAFIIAQGIMVSPIALEIMAKRPQRKSGKSVPQVAPPVDPFGGML